MDKSARFEMAKQKWCSVTVADGTGKDLPDQITHDSLLIKGLIVCAYAACQLNELAESHPTIARFSLTAMQVALGGPIAYVRDMAMDYTGVQDHVNAVVESSKVWVSYRLQEKGMNSDHANLLTQGGAFGLTIGLSVVGSASKDKILHEAKNVADIAKRIMRVKPINGRKPINSDFSGASFQ
jgi:hypothetical protein